MLYIHSLKDLSPKTAEVESVQIIRNIKDKIKTLISKEILSNNFSSYLIQLEDIGLITTSSEFIKPAIKEIKELIINKNPVYELINLNRAVSMLEELNEPVVNNINYLKEIELWQSQMLDDLFLIFNNISTAETMEEKKTLNNNINSIFKKILRNENLIFNSDGIINEGKFARINDLYKSLCEGFFFHITVKEHLDKVDFNTIKKRISLSEVEKVDSITKKILEVKKGVDKAYNYNMKMVQLSVNLYSYLKILIK